MIKILFNKLFVAAHFNIHTKNFFKELFIVVSLVISLQSFFEHQKKFFDKIIIKEIKRKIKNLNVVCFAHSLNHLRKLSINY